MCPAYIADQLRKYAQHSPGLDMTRISSSVPAATIILPARNEERYIGRVLDSLLELTQEFDVEMIVVDNGSDDSTCAIATERGVTVLSLEHGTAGAVRNRGAEEAKGSVLIFLDADVLVTESWRDSLTDVFKRLEKDSQQIIGARCLAADDSGLLNRYWFNRLSEYSASYINSGNLITSRKFFNTLNGFDASLETSEDHDFCQRALRAGGTVTEMPELETLHLGYPDTIVGFLQRERWHGRQDFASSKALRESKVAWVASANLLMFAVCLLFAAMTQSAFWFAVYGIFVLSMSVSLTVFRFGLHRMDRFAGSVAVFVLYIWGRSLSGIDALLGTHTRRAKDETVK